MGARQSKALFSVGRAENLLFQSSKNEAESEGEMPLGSPIGWDEAQNVLCKKRWDRLTSLYQKQLKEQSENVFIITLHGSLNPVHWDHIRMLEAGRKIIEKKVDGAIVIGAVGITRDERLVQKNLSKPS